MNNARTDITSFVFPLKVRRFYWFLLSGGFRGLLKRTLNRFFYYERFYLDVLSIKDDLNLFPPNLAKMLKRLRSRYQIEWLTEKSTGNLQPYLAYRQDLSEKEVFEWLHSGHVAVMALDRGKIIGDCWLALRSFPFPDRAIATMLENRGHAYSFRAYVDPSYRGQGVFPLLMSEQVEFIRQKGIKALLGAVSPNNTRSKQSGEKMGFSRAYTLHLLRVKSENYAWIVKVPSRSDSPNTMGKKR